MTITVTDSLIEARNLSAGYDGQAVVRELHLHVRPGEIVALLGPNGAGKTTTLMTLAGELPCVSGETYLDGELTRAPLHRRVASGLGLVTERRAVIMRLTVSENLRLTRGDTEYALTLFPELRPHLRRRVALLSGGQQQMLALALAFSRRPRVLLADELSLGLAPMVLDRLLTVLRDAADEGVGVLLVEQHVEKALSIADRAIVLRGGRVVLESSAAELRGNTDAVWRAYSAT
jgi:ABC-type branched-subunit amino acid transport system ATPase component